MRILKSQIGLLLAALILLSLQATAQLTSGNITGTVYDPTGASVPDAPVVAHNTATGVDVSTNSTSKGEFRFSNLAVGTYSIIVNAPGFAKTEVGNVTSA
jgi:hypothetical protein